MEPVSSACLPVLVPALPPELLLFRLRVPDVVVDGGAVLISPCNSWREELEVGPGMPGVNTCSRSRGNCGCDIAPVRDGTL
jgi:hypothetical protein